jgi:hypothetical protein
MRLDVLEEDLEEACERLGFVIEEPEQDKKEQDPGRIMAVRAGVTKQPPCPTDNSDIERALNRPEIVAAENPALIPDEAEPTDVDRPSLQSVAVDESEGEGSRPEAGLIVLAVIAIVGLVLVIKMLMAG